MPLPPALQDQLDRIGGPRRAVIFAIGIATAAVIFGVSRWATAPTFVPAFSNVPLEKVDKLTQKLTETGIQFELQQGGSTIAVKGEDLPKARVAIASGGEMPTSGRPGLELFDQPSWGMTDFTQRINYRRALEGELERTIGKMRGIEAAQVHIAMQEGSVFRAPDKPLEASVVLKLASGDSPTPDVVQGISHLVASSVDGLHSDHVTVVDDGGRMLTLDSDAASGVGLTSRQLGVQREVEAYLEKKAQSIVSQIVGVRNARVQVAAEINFDQVQRTTEAVDPDKQAIATEQRAEITPGAQGGAASSNVATSYETTKSTETFSGAIGNVKRLTVAVLVNDKVVTGSKPTTMPRSAEEIARIDTLVRNAVGVDSARGDKLSVVNVAFDAAMPLAADTLKAPDLLTRVTAAQKPLTTVVALVALLVVAVLTLRAAKPVAAPMQLAAAGAAPALAAGTSAPPALAAAGMTAAPNGQPAARPALENEGPQQILIAGPQNSGETVVLREIANPVRDQVVAIIDQRPEAATRVVRSWLKQD